MPGQAGDLPTVPLRSQGRRLCIDRGLRGLRRRVPASVPTTPFATCRIAHRQEAFNLRPTEWTARARQVALKPREQVVHQLLIAKQEPNVMR